MGDIINAAFQKSRTVIATLVLILISGFIAYSDIAKESNPDINIPYIFVNVTHRGISPEDSERLLIKPLEQELRAVAGIKEMKSTAFEGGAKVVLEFEAGFDSKQALLDVREEVDKAKAELPEDSDEPTVDELNFSLFPILVVSLTGDVPERSMLKIARDLQDEIEAIPSVLEADIAGDREEQIDIIVDPSKIESYGLSTYEVAQFFSRSNLLIAAGSLDTGAGRFSIKVPGLLEDIKDIMELPIKTVGDKSILLQDIATGRKTFKDPEGYARINGKTTVAIEVSKRIGENVIDTVARVKEVVEEESKYWPENLSYNFNQDSSEDIKDQLKDLQNNVISAIILVMIVVISALGIRSGLFVGIAVPGSFLLSILTLYMLGYTINNVVLFALILSVGMLVDGAIVVVEYADRKMCEGENKTKAYFMAAHRMAWPVIASTATTLAAFLPLAFWTGLVGEFMRFFPITLLFTLTASLLMALIFIPTIGSILGKPAKNSEEVIKNIVESETGDINKLSGLTGSYARFLQWGLKRSGKIIIFAIFMLFASQMLYAKFGNGVEFFPDTEPDKLIVKLQARGNLSIDEKDNLLKEVEERIIDINGYDTLYARSGASPHDSAEDVIGYINIELADWQEREKAEVITNDIRHRIRDLAGVKIEVDKEKKGPRSGKPIVIELTSRNNDLLPEAVNHIRGFMDNLEGLKNIEDSRDLPGIQWELEVDRAQASKFGVDINSVGDMVQMVTQGKKFSTYNPDDSDEEVDIVVRYPEEYRSITQLNRIKIATSDGKNIPISSFTKLVPTPRVNTINRVDGKRVLEVKADVKEGVLSNNKIKEITEFLNKNPLNPQVKYSFKGEQEDQQESKEFLSKAFMVALFIMAIILVTQFNSFYYSFLILSAVILSTIGVMFGLIITGMPFGVIMGGLGVISLAGIVVNNNIVLIDTYISLKDNYDTKFEAIIRTGVQRLRPVLLTTITTILGLIPMAIQLNMDFIDRNVTIGAPSMQMWAQLSVSVVSGLTFATLLTLIVTPCALMAWENLITKLKKK